jgi:hypothetical protein
MARVLGTTEYTEHTERHGSGLFNRRGTDAEVFLGERPREPPWSVMLLLGGTGILPVWRRETPPGRATLVPPSIARAPSSSKHLLVV